MSGNGKDDPRTPSAKPCGTGSVSRVGDAHVAYSEDDLALTQKLSRPKLPRIERIVPEPLGVPPTLLRPTQGGAVDASAFRRVRKISASNHVSVRMPEVAPASISEPTVARPAAIPLDAYLPEPAPSTIPDPSDSPTAKNRREPVETFEEATQRGPVYFPDDVDVESLRSSRDFEPRSLVTKQVPADLVRMLRSRAALETEVVGHLEGGLPVLIAESVPSSVGRDTSEALVLTKLAPSLHGLGIDDPPLRGPNDPFPLAATRLSSERNVPTAAQPGPDRPPPKPTPQLHTLPLGIKPADLLAGLARAEAGGVNMRAASAQAAPSANMHSANTPAQGQPRGPEPAPVGGTAAMPSRSPSGEMRALSGSAPSLGQGAFASSGALPTAQPSLGVFPHQAAPGQRHPSGQMQAQGQPNHQHPNNPSGFQPDASGAMPYAAQGSMQAAMQGAQMPHGAQGQGTFPPGSMQTPPGAMPHQQAASGPQGQGTFPPGAMPHQQAANGPQGQGTFPPGSMQGALGAMLHGQQPAHGQGTFPPGSMQRPPPAGTYPPGSMQAAIHGGQGQGTYPPGSGPGQGTFPPGSGPGSMQAPHGPAFSAVGTFPPGSMQAPPGSMGGPPQQGAFVQGPIAGAGWAEGTFPPGSGGSPSSGGPGAAVAIPKPSSGKSTWVLMLLALAVFLACGAAWLSIKGKRLPWKHGRLGSPLASVRNV